jgi:crotonobetainyl-CoA:carnitine CoA-transferase CaiB-like acyl-CoA transferase
LLIIFENVVSGPVFASGEPICPSPDEGASMHHPMAGVRVLEVAMYGFVTSAGAVLADWGAEVLKVEHAVTAIPSAGLRRTGSFVVEGDLNPNVEHPNRGKRSLGLDISHPAAARCSTSWPSVPTCSSPASCPPAAPAFGIDVDDIRAQNPDIIYARGSALGPRGEEADRGGYDMTAFWCRASTGGQHHAARRRRA